MAATGSISGLDIATSGSTGKISKETNGVTLTVSKGWSVGGGTSEDTFTFTYPSTNTSDVQVSFDYSFSGTAKTISGVTEDIGTKCSVTLSPGDSFSIYMKATAGRLSSATSTFSITNLNVIEVVDSAQVTVEYDASLGSVTADGSTVEASKILTVPSSGTSFVATPSGDANFLAWIDGNGKVISREKNCVCKPTEATLTLKAVFATTTPWFYVDNGDYLVEGWEEAVTHTGTVALANNATLSAGNYSVPANVIMLIPYDSALTASVEAPVVQPPTSSQATPTAYRTLSMESGAHISVNGTLTVPAAVRAGDTTTSLAATMVKGTYGHISMNSGSSITVKSGAKLSTYGYITGSGSVIAESGAKVYEAFQVMRFRGGSATASMATAKKSFPISQYYVQNIEVPLTLYSGASEIAYVALYMSDTVIDSQVEYIGQSGCLFNLTSGYMVKQYDKANDRQQIDFYGDLTVSKFAINIKFIINYPIDSSDFVVPITNNMTVDIHDGATVTIGANMSILPGAEIDIHKGGTLLLSSGKSLYLYDLAEWSGKGFLYGGSDLAALPFVPNRTKTRTASDLKDAQIIVAGTLEASAGKLYTSTNGAAIKGTEGGQAMLTFTSSTVDRQATQSGTNISYVEITMNSAYLQHGNGEYMVTATDTYTYSDDVWKCTNHSYDEGIETTFATCTTEGEKTYTCTVCEGTKTEIIPVNVNNHEEVADAAVPPTCTQTGWTEGSHCYGCGLVINAQQVIPATGHTEVTDAGRAATCTETGLTEGKHCSVCSEVTVSQTEIPALGHKGVEVTIAPTCTETGIASRSECDVCGEVLEEGAVVPALGHNEVIDAAVFATCTETGLTEGKHCSVCNVVLVVQEVVPSLGHTEVVDVAIAATCTETGLTQGSHCGICGETLIAQEVVSAIGHNEVADAAVDATCTVPGKTAGSHCAICGETIVEQEVVEATGHAEVTDAGAAPTCTTPGYTAGSHCATCGEVFVAQEVIPATGHTYGDWTITTTPTSKTKGVETRTCGVCEESETRTIIAIYGTSVRVGDSLDLYFYVRNDMLDGTAYYAQITRSYADNVSTEDALDPYTETLDPIPFAKWEPYGEYYRFCYSGIAGKEMTDQVSVTIYHEDGTYASIPATETIADYALRTLKSSTATEELKAVLMDMVRYGANCQTYFNYNTENLAGSKEDFDSYSSCGGTKLQQWDKNDNSGNFSASVVAENRLVYSFYLSDVTSNTVTVSYANHYNQSKSFDITPVYNENKMLYCVDVPELAVADGHQKITCTYTDSTGIQTVTGSIEGYLAKIDGTEEDSIVFETLMYFVDSAYAYFH